MSDVTAIAEFEKLFVPTQGRTLIVGSRVYGSKEDRRKRYADVIGADMQAGDGCDVVVDLETDRLDGVFAHIECMSVLEHVRRPWLLCANVEAMMAPGGSIFITVPFVWRVHGYPDDYWRMTISGVKSLFSAVQWKHEAYTHSHSRVCAGQDIPLITAGNDWPYMAVTQTCLFGVRP